MTRTLLYVGCYTTVSDVGIRVFDATDPARTPTELSRVEGVEHASFLAAHPNRRVLYAVSETSAFDGRDGGGIVAFAIDPADGSLTLLDRVSSHGAAPCYVSVAADGRHLYVANYLSGSIAVYELDHLGRIGRFVERAQHHGSGPTARQTGPHAHCVVPGPAGGSVYAVDLGIDQVIRYRHGGGPEETPFAAHEYLSVEPGAGPRHLRFHPDEPVAFLVCELQSTLAVLSLDPATERLDMVENRSTLPDDFAGESIAAEVAVHPRGHRIYVSNRGHDSIAVFGFAGGNEPLERLGHVASGGRQPRNIAVHPSGEALLAANQDSHNMVVFRIDHPSGMPHPINVIDDVPEPVCLTFVEVGE